MTVEKHSFVLLVEIQQLEQEPDFEAQQAVLDSLLEVLERYGIAVSKIEDMIAHFDVEPDDAPQQLLQASMAADQFFAETGWPVSVSLICDTTRVVNQKPEQSSYSHLKYQDVY